MTLLSPPRRLVQRHLLSLLCENIGTPPDSTEPSKGNELANGYANRGAQLIEKSKAKITISDAKHEVK